MSGVYKYSTKAGDRWRIVYDGPPVYDPETGQVSRKQTSRRGFTRERDAKQALREELNDIDDGSHVPIDQVTVGRYIIDEWLPSIRPRSAEAARRHRGTVNVATHDRYRQDLERWVLPRIGGVKLQALTPKAIDKLYDELETSGRRDGGPLSPKTVANLHGVLHKALGDAVKRGRLKRNPAAAVSPPTATQREPRWWSVDELRAFVRFVEGDELYAAWLLFATTGAREGEVCGLTWDDLDLDAGWVRVDWTLGVIRGKLTWKPRPKSKAGERLMALDPATVAALRQRKLEQNKQRLAAGSLWQDSYTDWQGLTRSGLVWTYEDGSPLSPNAVYGHFVKHVTDAGLPRVSLHDVMHSYASAALAAATGWHDVKVISQRLGHATVAITLDTYSHVLPAADEKIAHTLATVILGE